MIVKQIESDKVVSQIQAGKEVYCINFGEVQNICKVGAYNLTNQPMKIIMDAIKTPGNLFFLKKVKKK